MSDTDSAQAFREAFRQRKQCTVTVIVAGAGLSAASGRRDVRRDTDISQTKYAGIPTFRDGSGMWRSLDSTALAVHAGRL